MLVRQIQVAGSSNVEVAPPSDAYYSGLSFSKDGNYIFYLKNDPAAPRAGALPGAVARRRRGPRSRSRGCSPSLSRRAEAVSLFFATSPSGNRVNSSWRGPTARANGSSPRPSIHRFLGGDDSAPVWSPDGRTIACGLADSTANTMTVVGVDAENGATKPLTSRRWFRVGRLTWMPDGGGLVMLRHTGSEVLLPPLVPVFSLRRSADDFERPE